jgi:drug/metabolite transporter (DMT)-like permease
MEPSGIFTGFITRKDQPVHFNPKRARANLLLLLAALIWGLTFAAQKQAADAVEPFSFNAVRFALGAVFISLVIGVRERRRGATRDQKRVWNRQVVLPGFICGVLLVAAAGLQQAAMKDTTAGNASFVTGLYLVLVPILGVFLGQRIHWLAVAGVAIAVVGLYLIAINDTFTLLRGDGLVMMAALCFAVQILAVDRWAGRLPALRFAATQFWTCALLSGVAALVLDKHPYQGLELALIPLLYGGLAAVGLAYTFQVLAQRDAEPTQASLIMALEAVFGALGGAVLLHENMGGRGYLGAVLMCLGMVLSQLNPRSAVTQNASQRSV